MEKLPEFVFVACQVGAERALKLEMQREHSDFRFAFSRPGFLTFKLPAEHTLADDFELHSVFARTYGFSLGKVAGDDPDQLARQVWQLAGPGAYRHLHVWQRDLQAPGDHGFEPGLTPLAAEAAERIAACDPRAASAEKPVVVDGVARARQLVLDCVLVEPNEWWVGCHRAASMPSRWPGGVCPVELPPHAVSRAYVKMTEAIQWSRLPLAAGERCVEIGSSPGGSCQALLDRGLLVTGVDPAEMDPVLLSHPNFTYVRKRGSEMKRRDFRGVRWLMADSNVAPNHTLDTIEAIVTHRLVHIRGLLLTLKLLNWELAAEIPAYLERIRGWGYRYVNARQLAFNRQEICVAALSSRSLRRPPRLTSGGR